VWGTLQEKVYKTCMSGLDDLKHRIRTEWAKLDHAVIASAVHRSVASSSQHVSRPAAVIWKYGIVEFNVPLDTL